MNTVYITQRSVLLIISLLREDTVGEMAFLEKNYLKCVSTVLIVF